MSATGKKSAAKASGTASKAKPKSAARAEGTPRVTKKSTAKAARAAAGRKEPAASDGEFDGTERLYAFADDVTEKEAAPEESKEREVNLETWVTFGLAGELFALPIMVAREILRVRKITRVPHAPYTVRGIVNMRGRVVPVIDFRTRLGLPTVELGPQSRILITSTRNRFLGLLVDHVDQVVQIDLNAVEPVPGDIMTDQSEYIIGVYHVEERLLILLDVEKVLLIPDSLETVNSGAVVS